MFTTFSAPDFEAHLREMRELPQQVQQRLVKGAVATGASVIRKASIAKAPVFTGEVADGHPPPGTLKRSIYQTRLVELCTYTQEVWKVDVRRGKRVIRRGKAAGTTTRDRDAFYALWVEYGHYTRTPGKKRVQGSRKARQQMGMNFGSVRWVPGQPFMRPAFESAKNDALKAIEQYLLDHMPEVLQRFKTIGRT